MRDEAKISFKKSPLIQEVFRRAWHKKTLHWKSQTGPI